MPKALRGFWRYVPGELFPAEATALLSRDPFFHAAGRVMNQVPLSDVTIRQRYFASERRVAGLGPAYERKEGADVASR